jgi:hypothetical protein
LVDKAKGLVADSDDAADKKDDEAKA